MRSIEGMTLPESIAEGARPPTPDERGTMMAIVARLDEALGAGNPRALEPLFTPDAVCELKPTGLRLESRETLLEMFRRILPAMSASHHGRRQDRIWANQNGIVREWSFSVRLRSGESAPSRQLEVIEFADSNAAIASYRLRMSQLYARDFQHALGDDFAALSDVRRISG